MFEIVLGIVGVIVAVLAWQYPKRHPRISANETGGNAKGGSDQSHPDGYVPDGVVFGDKAVLVPGFQQLLFTLSGQIESNVLRGKQYSWIKRGEIIGRYHMDVPNLDVDYFRPFLGSKHLSVDVKSPVSGLILHSFFNDFTHWPAPENAEAEPPTAPLSILIADDEPPPEANGYMYAPALRFIELHKGPLFRPSRYWGLGPMTEEQFSELVQAQKDAQCLIVDAMPNYKDYFEEARTRYPNLRPYLRHLQ